MAVVTTSHRSWARSSKPGQPASTFATRYAKNAGVIGIDLGSSGYRNATWAGNSADADWNRIASRAAPWAMATRATPHGNRH